MTTDDDFAHDLRARLDDAMPPLTVRTDRVLPRARRRRAVTRSAGVTGAVGAVALVAVAAVGGWSGDGLGWWRGAAPAGTETLTSTSVPSDPATTPLAEPTAPPAADAGTGPAAGSIADAEGHPYWYVRSTSTGPTGTEVRDSWYSLTEPGIAIVDDDPGTAFAFGPKSVLGTYVVGGVRYEMLTDVTLLPTDPQALLAVLQDSVEPDRRSGTDEDKVFGMITDLLSFNPGLLPQDLRTALWRAADLLPDVDVTSGTDSPGRAGDVLDYSGNEGPVRLVGDPVTGLLLEQASGDYATVYTTMGPADSTPIEPTLELAGCTAWASC